MPIEINKIKRTLVEEAEKRGIKDYTIVKTTHYNKKTGMFFKSSKVWNLEIERGRQGSITFTFDDNGEVIKIEENLLKA